MPLDIAALGSRAACDVACDARWLMAHAAVVGAHGLASAADHFDTVAAAGVCAHPLFSVAPEWALLTQRVDPFGLGLDRAERAAGVHASHHVVYHNPIWAPTSIRLEAEIVGIHPLPSGALVTIRFDAVDAAGLPLWTSWMGTVHRGVAIVGGADAVADGVGTQGPVGRVPTGNVDRGAAKRGVADRGAAGVRRVSWSVAAGDAHTYTEAARIWNPIHTDRAVALRAGLPGIILHGTATLAYAVTAVMREFGVSAANVRSVSGSFRAMVLMPSQLHISMRLEPPDGGQMLCRFDVRIAATAGEPSDQWAIKSGAVMIAC